MNTEIRRSGIDIIGDVPWGSHFCQFYRTAGDLLDVLIPYFAAGLAANEFCMWITSEPVDKAAAEAALAGSVPGFERYARAGQIEIIPHSEWYLAGGGFDADRVLGAWAAKLTAARARGFEGLRLSGNTFWLEQKDWRAFTDYEAAVDEVIGGSRMIALCTYSLERCGANEVLDVVRNHRFAMVRREGDWELVESAERRRVQEALRAGEERYRTLFNNMSEGLAVHEIITDDQGHPVDYRFLDVNPAFERLTGLRRSETQGRTVREVLKDIEPFWIETYGRVALTGEPLQFERYYPAPLNRWYEIHAYSPKPRQFATVFMDISQRKRVEEALRESEQRYERSQEIAHLGSWELDVVGDHLTWSDEVYRIFGLRPREFAATYEAFLAAVHPEDRVAVDAVYQESLREGRDAYEIEHRIVRRDTGEVRTVHEKCEHVRDVSGRIVRSVGMVHDITERKRTEALRQALDEQERLRLGAAVELATEAVIMAEPDGRILYVNAAFETINRLSKHEALGRNFFELVPADPQSGRMRQAVTRGTAWNGRLTLTRSGGRPLELAVVVTPVQDPPGLLITERDITQEVLLQDQVRQAQKMESLGTLAGGIAHDFNNILGAIVINAELALMDTEESCPARESLPLVLRAAERGKELVRQIVTFSRQQEYEKSDLPIAPVVREALKLFRATLPATVTLNASIGAEKAAVLGNPGQIHQILMNLCRNAALAMTDRPGTLDVRLDTTEVDAATATRHAGLKPGPYVRLSVADSGSGMTREVQERIFEPFFTTRRQGEGSGLGLSVVHGIVRSFGGAITVYSEPGQGSTFTVFLPLLGEAGEAGEAPARPAAEPGTERILLVDDDATQLESLGRMLGKLGYRVLMRSSGQEAQEAFARDPAAVDLVITDQTMPGMSGIELARSLSGLRPDLPIILNTGFSEKVNGGTVGRDGIKAFLMKPFTASELTALVRRVLKAGG